ncbi:MAG TPA: carbon-nitrogen family hydrolase [Acidimicrobiia bacterium]|nr:carbon-nitrogen family hydrolase [Acidimicrobiia bacterium]
MRVAAVQHDIVWEDREANYARLAPMIHAAAAAGARLVALTEMFATGFSMDAARVAEPRDGPSSQFLCEQARANGVWVCGSIAERALGVDRPYNTFVLAAPGGVLHRYDKIHPFTYSGEHEHYSAGTELVTVDVDGLAVSPFVCYDLRFADELWPLAPSTDLYIVVANWPESRRLHWQVLLRARAIENQAYVVGVNRVGTGGRLTYAGDSCVIDPLGEVLASAAGGETLVLADVDPGVVRATRERFPFLTDRRMGGDRPVS